MAESIEREKSGLKKRETWSRELDYFLACVGFSIGLGNVWRFPYLCYKNGGGAFLIPYFLSLVVAGGPMFYLETAIGQYMSNSGPRAWTLVPVFQGIGIASVVIAFYVNCYYNVILAWAFRYLFASFTAELPWENCGHEWNTPNCLATSNTTFNVTTGALTNVTDPVVEFWENKVLRISDGLHQPGIVLWDLALCLLLAWIVVYLCICKGIRTSGKVMYFTATAPYFFMLILLIRNCTLDGSYNGIEFYLKPNMTKLTEPEVWVDAGTQIFFSWTIAMGTTLALGSYNKFHHNSLRDAIGFTVVNASTSFLAGFIVFSILGFMAKQQNVLVSDVAESGPGLAFIAYPKAVAHLPLSPFWSVLFFAMLIFLGLDSQFVTVESFISAVVDQYPHILRRGHRKEVFVGFSCFIMFLIGLPMVNENGMYVFQIFDYYGGGRVIPLVALFQVTAVSYCYGLQRFISNVRMMIGDSPLWHIMPYFRISWGFVTPVFCLSMIILSLYDYSELTYKRPNRPLYVYPWWGVSIGWGLAIFSLIWIPIVAIYKVGRLLSMGGRFSNGDFHLLTVPYHLQEHQKRPEDEHERTLADFERECKQEYFTEENIVQFDEYKTEQCKIVECV